MFNNNLAIYKAYLRFMKTPGVCVNSFTVANHIKFIEYVCDYHEYELYDIIIKYYIELKYVDVLIFINKLYSGDTMIFPHIIKIGRMDILRCLISHGVEFDITCIYHASNNINVIKRAKELDILGYNKNYQFEHLPYTKDLDVFHYLHYNGYNIICDVYHISKRLNHVNCVNFYLDYIRVIHKEHCCCYNTKKILWC